ncbi:MAG: response regulator [Nitrospirae bacterium]|nr:response regulator [Nitrospirota bacterium]
MSKKILMADDDVVILKVGKFNLEKAGYEVITAVNGEDAVETARREGPDLIILDVMMPVMDGYTALLNLRGYEETKDIPVIILTAQEGGVYKQISVDMGAVEHLNKPFNPNDLVEKVATLLG